MKIRQSLLKGHSAIIVDNITICSLVITEINKNNKVVF